MPAMSASPELRGLCLLRFRPRMLPFRPENFHTLLLRQAAPREHIRPTENPMRAFLAGKLGRLHYSWVVMAVIFLCLLAAAGVRATPGVLIVPWQQSLGWDRATISLAIAINVFLYGLMGPFAAACMLRFGIRRTVLSALALLAAVVAASTQMRAPWELRLSCGV